jgi:hypothetical protein
MHEVDAIDLRVMANEACVVGCIREACALESAARVLEASVEAHAELSGWALQLRA